MVIPPQGDEVVRDRIGAILAMEIEAQYIMGYTPELADVKVYSERSNSFDKTELPAINVSLGQGSWDNKHQGNVMGTYIFNIDIYVNAKTKPSGAGDELAAFRLQRLKGVCRYILEDPRYKTLGFEPPFIWNVHCVEIQIAQATKDDADTTRMGRLTVSVQCTESNVLIIPPLIAGYESTVRLDGSTRGYYWEGI